jgi:hypothetical protein
MNRLKAVVSGALQSGAVKDVVRAITLNEIKVKGRLVGTDAMGNRYFEADEEITDRRRWVEYANSDVSHWMQHGFDPSQVLVPPPPPSRPFHSSNMSPPRPIFPHLPH